MIKRWFFGGVALWLSAAVQAHPGHEVTEPHSLINTLHQWTGAGYGGLLAVAAMALLARGVGFKPSFWITLLGVAVSLSATLALLG
jgi:hypothetical protein